MRIIDADELKLKESLEEAKQWREEAEAKGDTEIAIRADGVYSVFIELLLRVRALPMIDAVQVVRCKDCKYKSAERELAKLCWCCRKQRWDDREGFCSDGERREE